jgi:hypothetical protein
MAFGFDDFAKLFDPVSDVLGTSGKQGIGLLQQKPEDLQRAAMLAALVASGGSAAGLFGPGAAVGTAAAGPSAALTLAPEAAGILGETAALTPEIATLGADAATNAGIDSLYANSAGIANQYAMPSNFIGEGTQTAGLGNLIYGEPVSLDTPTLESMGYLNVNEAGQPVGVGTGTNPFPGYQENAMARASAQRGLNPNLSGLENQIDLINKGPGYTDYLNDTSAKSLYKINSFEDYQLDQARRAAAEGAKSSSTVDMSLGRQSVPDYTSFEDSFHKSSITPDRFQNLEGLRVPDSGPYQIGSGDYLNNSPQVESAFDKGVRKAGEYFDKASDYVEKNPYKSAGLAYFGASKLGLLDQPKQEQIASDYKNPYSMAGFRRSSPNPSAYRYTPRYAEGGIAGYAKGGRSKAQSAMDFYDAMNSRQESAPPSHGSPGIYYDADPDTRYLDPMEAAMVRMSKLNSRANVQAPTMTPSRRMGELDFKPVAAAQGGIMGYADGGDVPIEEDEFNRLTGRGGGGRTKAEADAKFSPTSEGAAAVSQFGQGMKDYPALAPGGMAAQIIGAIASSYGDHMARNVNPNYGNEAMNTSAGKNLGLPSISADDDNSVVLGLGGDSGGAGVSSSDFGGGSFDPAGRDSDGTPLAKGGGIMGYNLGGYAAGGNPRLLRGPGDGMSDHIPATINNRQPARLADGEYVITADVVSHLGNGSTEAGARQLDAMMKRIRKGRTGTPKQGKQINPRKYLPA